MTTEHPIVAFLRARLDEDEEVAQATRKNEQRVDGTDRWFASHGNAITSMAPHRAVAEVEAKRQILDEHAPRMIMVMSGDGTGYPGIHCGCCSPGDPGKRQIFPCRTVLALALPYSDHEDFDPAWSAE